MSSLTPWAVSSVVSSEGALILLFYTAAAAQTNTPRLAAGTALFQPRDWFSAAQLSLSLAIRIVCQKMDECNLSKYIDRVSYLLSWISYSSIAIVIVLSPSPTSAGGHPEGARSRAAGPPHWKESAEVVHLVRMLPGRLPSEV